MSEMTVYACNIESVDSMGFPLQTERTVYLASDIDPMLSPPGEGLTGVPCCFCGYNGHVEDQCLLDPYPMGIHCECWSDSGGMEVEADDITTRELSLKADLATLHAELEGVRGPENQTGSYAWYRKECHRMHLTINEFCCLETKLKGDIIDLTQQLAAREGQVKDLEEALEFYANPDTYFACAFVFDRPTGGFDEDFDEGHEDYDRPMPGKMARQALKPSA